MVKKLAYLCLILVTGAPLGAHAQSAGAFSRMGFGARGVALGNALVADVMGDASPYYNPALAPFATRQNLEAAAALLSFDRELQFLQFAAPIQPSAGIAVGLVHAGVSNIDGRDNSGYHTRDYSTDEFAFFLAFGTRFSERISAGVGLQLFRTDLIDELEAVHSIGLDVGLTAAPSERLRFGLAVEDLLARYSWDTSELYGSAGTTTSDRFPVRIRVGAAYALMDGRAQVLAEYESRLSGKEHRTRSVQFVGAGPAETVESHRATLRQSGLRIGGEYLLSDALTLRGGVDRIGNAVRGTTPSAGFMVAQPVGPLGVRGEYAFMLEPYNTGAMHLISLRIFL